MPCYAYATCKEPALGLVPIGSGQQHILMGGGGEAKGPLRSPKRKGLFSKFKRHSIAIYVNFPNKVKNWLWGFDDVTVHVKAKMFDISVLVSLASKISMFSANKTNELTWIVSLTFVSINPRPYRGGGGWCNTPWGFSRIAKKRAGFWATLWGKPSAIFGKKNLTGSGQITELWRHKRNNLRQI